MTKYQVNVHICVSYRGQKKAELAGTALKPEEITRKAASTTFEAKTLTQAKTKATRFVKECDEITDWFNRANDKYGWPRVEQKFNAWHPDKKEQENYYGGREHYQEVNDYGIEMCYCRRFSDEDFSDNTYVSIYLIWTA